MSGSLSGLSKAGRMLGFFLIATLCVGMPATGHSQIKGDTIAVSKTTTVSKKQTRKARKKKAKAKRHQEITHGSENNAELERIKAEKNKEKGIK